MLKVLAPEFFWAEQAENEIIIKIGYVDTYTANSSLNFTFNYVLLCEQLLKSYG